MRSTYILLINLTLAACSFVMVDWSNNTVSDAIAYILDYSPPVGVPQAGSSLDSAVSYVFINGTVSATEYTLSLSAVMSNGKRRNITERTGYSSPDPPFIDTIETTEHEAAISYFAPKGDNISYHIEYYPEDHKEFSNIVETKTTNIRLRGLDAGTVFRLRIRSVFKGVYSQDITESSFRTEGIRNHDSSHFAETFSVRTLPPDFDLARVPTSYYGYGKKTNNERISTEYPTMSSGLGPSYKTSVTVTTTSATIIQNSTVTPTLVWTPLNTAGTASEILSNVTSVRTLAVSSFTTPLSNSWSSMLNGTSSTEVDADKYKAGMELGTPISLKEMKSEFGEPGEIKMSQTGNLVRLDWSVPEDSLCDAYFLNYTILSLDRPKSFSIATPDDYTTLKLFPEHTLDLRVFCMLAGALSKTWWAHRIAHMSKPKPVEGLRIVSTETDEFYTSTISVNWKWPINHDFGKYKLVLSCKNMVGPSRDTEVKNFGPVVLDKLEPAQLYTISVRNESTELNLQSKATVIEQITPPLISSTLFPGKISSTAININFDESDLEQGRFDHYILIFSGNNKNITKRIEINQERSLTFTKLIPGKTYHFTLYTVYRGVYSRPVSDAVTTYPLKVNQLYSVVGREYVILYWDIENFASNDCHFRLSYHADKIPTISVDLKGASRHRFTGLVPDVYYTFTITVIMGTGKAAAESDSEMVTVYIPNGHLSPTLQRQGSRELLVQFEYDLTVFPILNGALDNFAVIVSDDSTKNDDNYELRSWFEVKNEEVWGSYRASPSDWNPFSRGTELAKFTIGTDDCERIDLDEPYCNGILRANVNYKVKLRAYSNMRIAMETDWVTVEDIVEEEEKHEKSERRLPCHMYLNGCPRKYVIHNSSLVPFIFMILCLFRLFYQ